ncbi:NUDIX hydrolase [Lentilactobacillus sp. Marseille-Q4993]|uniref:NUDIX hydrolase n=1 Tax=Lentilactobacillus sp. Marseille-Q4993 TaxID=3039492 RepID=UPI0024BCBB0F|nr:NUDIX hydrolase [Lentilactobacillus sp. Marseille-Q4993]
MDFEEKVLSTEKIYNGAIIDVIKQKVELPDGQTSYREIVRHAKAVGVLAITDDDKMILEKQWRAPVSETVLEIPAGKLDSRDKSSEHAVYRELNEELRMKPAEIKLLTGFYSTVGFSDEYMELYLAKGLKPVTDELPRDKGEFLELSKVSLSEALKMLANGEIKDAKTTTAILYWQFLENQE